jgi:hypothetical protein
MRRGDPNRIFEAKLAGLRARIVSQWRQPGERADALLAECEQEASRRGLDGTVSAFWDEGAHWIEEQVRS